TQKAEALIINRNPDNSGDFESFEELSRICANFPGQLGENLREDFHFNYVFISEALKPEVHKQIPQPDFVINNHVNGEVLVSQGKLAELNELLDSFGVPVVNHPTKVVPTIRDLEARLLEGIEGLKVPKTLRFSRGIKSVEALAREIEAHYDYPLITRGLTAQ